MVIPMLKFVHDGAVELYHDNTKKAETSTQGLLIPNTLGVSFGDAGCKVTGNGWWWCKCWFVLYDQ